MPFHQRPESSFASRVTAGAFGFFAFTAAKAASDEERKSLLQLAQIWHQAATNLEARASSPQPQER
jgi:hypothetical protein